MATDFQAFFEKDARVSFHAEEAAFQFKSQLTLGITGATGLLGRNVLFEVLKQYIDKLYQVRFVILGRTDKDIALSARVRAILESDGLVYLNLPKQTHLIDRILSRMIFIEMDFTQASNPPASIALLQSFRFDYFFHFAAESDFRNNPEIEFKLKRTNIEGTRALLDILDPVQISKFIYTGTAYSFGRISTTVLPHSNFSEAVNFRNHYEQTKLMGEKLVSDLMNQQKKRFQILRPVGICGRASEPIVGQTCKFDLFYAWAAFFVRLKFNKGYSDRDLYTQVLDAKMRVVCRKESFLNILPVDYAAKMVWAIANSELSGTHFHLSNPYLVHSRTLLGFLLSELKITGVEFVETPPTQLTRLEKLYYGSVGEAFTPYLEMPKIEFSTDNLGQLKALKPFKGIEYAPDLLKKILDYAKLKNFGVSRTRIKTRV